MTTKTTTTSPKPTVRLASDALLALGRLAHLNLASNSEAKRLRADVPTGSHQGEVTFRLTYDIRKGEDHEAEVSQTVPWKALAGILFGKLNAATRDAVIREALTSAEGGGFELADGVQNPEAEAAIAALLGRTRKVVSGKITGNAVLTVVGEEG